MKTITKKQAFEAIVNADRVYFCGDEINTIRAEDGNLCLAHINTDSDDEWYGASYEFELGDDFIYQIDGNKIYAKYTKTEDVFPLEGTAEEITLFKEIPYCPYAEHGS
jgi:hypothetical protein